MKPGVTVIARVDFLREFAPRKAIALWNAAAYILCENFLKVVASGRIK